MEKSFTDNEIIKALECFSSEYGCKGCPFIEQGCFDCGNIPIDLSKSILYLINRQRAEIERLETLYSFAVKERESNVKGFIEDLKSARSEARKEFGAALKKRFHDNSDSIVSLVVVFREINNLLAGMESSDNG